MEDHAEAFQKILLRVWRVDALRGVHPQDGANFGVYDRLAFGAGAGKGVGIWEQCSANYRLMHNEADLG